MQASKSQLARIQSDWTRIAGEPVTIEQINGDFYAFGSELACLRLHYQFRNSPGSPRAEYSQNLQTWFYTHTSLWNQAS